MTFEQAMAALPLIAILRGVRPEEAEAVGGALLDAGVTLIEVPLNSPEPFRSIEILATRLAGRAVVGAGTVLRAADTARIAAAGGSLCVMPHADPVVIAAAKEAGLVCLPGVATPTEAFAALAAGADGLKLFPAEVLPPAVVKAWRAVLPKGTRLFPVGGIEPASMAGYVGAGASGFGLGSALYKPGMEAGEVAGRARGFVAAWRALSG